MSIGIGKIFTKVSLKRQFDTIKWDCFKEVGLSNKQEEEKRLELVTGQSLQSFFYSHFDDLNKLSMEPLPMEVLFYASRVMDKFHLSKNFFEKIEGRVENKILGKKILEIDHLSKIAKKRQLREVADTALCLVGFFGDSIERKLVDQSYYRDLGRISYLRLHEIISSAYEIQGFYELMAYHFSDMTTLMNLVSHKVMNDSGSEISFILKDRIA